jgi:hypothetical protein
MKISMEKAWERAVALLKGNKDVLAILAGVFFFVPGFAGVFFLGTPPQVVQGMSPEQILPLFETYFVSVLPYLIVVAFIGAIGRLAMLVLFTDRSRPTVQEALRRGVIGVLPYILATLLVGMALALLAAVLVIAPSKLGAGVVTLLTGPLLIALIIYASIKISLVPAVIVAESATNPLAAVRRSWRLTKGNSLRLLLFYVLLVVPYVIIAALAEGLFGAIGAVVGGAQGQLFIGGAASSLVGAVWGALSAAITAALYEQLAGRPEGEVARTFD